MSYEEDQASWVDKTGISLGDVIIGGKKLRALVLSADLKEPGYMTRGTVRVQLQDNTIHTIGINQVIGEVA